MERLESGAKKLGLHLTSKQVEQFNAYYQELVDWNRRINLTAITGYEEVQTKHFLDSLTITTALSGQKDTGNLSIIDVGTGAGLPGIPLGILWPAANLTLLEATAKKADFLRHLKFKLGLDKVEIVAGRAEIIAHEARYREKFELVLSRAVASLPALVELTLPFCAVGGRFIAQKKGNVEDEISQAGGAMELLGGRLMKVMGLRMEEFPDERYLIVIDKVSPTPRKYPRRPGMPVKRPIV